MRGISVERLKEIGSGYMSDNAKNALIRDECRELQEPWMTLDEFLRSGFEGLCFVSIESYVILSERTNFAFFGTNGIMFDISSITHVMPIHKPELPR